ncbi:amidohydrolase family protein [Cellulomonas sp. zg-ZUI199]|uniref:Amidohydrolase family protein n=1 Tax=Cellulomonas wangleii TaxID=2816956 RepID=A0ABX8CZX9_9CELL|nr:amidohydrolase family protein [Cellulomonas wangleii]MBO0926646.1 amidohydrolase family protein [Cellulomonas wangleii]QVI60802.1 amidohydrolase family protein [Cellulomonas wangleii]
MSSTLYRHGVVHSPADPFAEALLVENGVVAWLGSDDTADGLVAGVDEVVELGGALVAPAFVDAHVHLLETALAAAGLDLTGASLPAVLDAVAAVAARRGAGDRRVVHGTGWDEGAWPEGRAPTRAELDAAGQGLPVYLARVDVHSAVVSSALADLAGLRDLPGWSQDGLVVGAAHHAARDVALAVDAQERTALYRDALRRAAAAGIVAVHEQSAPHVDTRDGLRELLTTTADAASALPLVVGYRAEACVTVDDARALLADLPGLTGIGGDLNVDGSLGSRTAALRHPYADAPGTSGTLHLTAEQIANHVTAVTRAGSQAGFHVIGDRALDELLLGMRAAADVEGSAAIAAAGHRVEHAEMVDAHSLAQILLLGLRLSVQPAFDATWGGPGGMYAARLGQGRAAALNPFADLAAAGVPLALGSDTPVTPFDPWGGVRAASAHHQADQRISARAAFRAATRGGWRLAGLDHSGAGELRVGAPAHLAVWQAEHLVVQASRTSTWSADARAGSPLLPDLGPDEPAPRCLRTVRAGVVLHDALG